MLLVCMLSWWRVYTIPDPFQFEISKYYQIIYTHTALAKVVLMPLSDICMKPGIKSHDKLFQIKGRKTLRPLCWVCGWKKTLCEQVRLQYKIIFLPFQVNTIPVLGGGSHHNIFWLRAERPLSALVKQFWPPEQRWDFKLPPFISGRVITPGSQSRRYRFQGI